MMWYVADLSRFAARAEPQPAAEGGPPVDRIPGGDEKAASMKRPTDETDEFGNRCRDFESFCGAGCPICHTCGVHCEHSEQEQQAALDAVNQLSRGVRVRELLEEGKQLQQRLSAFASMLNDELERAEKAMADLRLGIEVSLVTQLDHSTKVALEHLAFKKVDGKWRLMRMWRKGWGEHVQQNEAPAVDGSRDERARALSHVPTLLEMLVREAREKVTGYEKLLERPPL